MIANSPSRPCRITGAEADELCIRPFGTPVSSKSESFYNEPSGLAAFCEAASRVKCGVHLPLTFRGCAAVLELLLSLLFAFLPEARWPRRIWVCEGADGAN